VVGAFQLFAGIMDLSGIVGASIDRQRNHRWIVLRYRWISTGQCFQVALSMDRPDLFTEVSKSVSQSVFFLYEFHEPQLVSHETVSSSAECSRDKPPFSFVRGQDSTMWNIVWVSPQGHRSVPVSRHFLLQAPQCPCSVQKRFGKNHCCQGRS